MGVKFKNNAESTLDSAISAVDVGLTVAYGDGSLFPSLGVDEYFFMTIESTEGDYEIVTVTARSGDAMTIVRAQENTTARAFTAGARCELRVTNQGLLDLVQGDNISDGTLALDKLATTSTSIVLGRRSDQSSIKQITANDVLNMIGSTRGQVLYRGASAWSALGVGTAGQVLQSGGAGADPSWATGILVTDGDKGSITVSSSGTVWTLDDAAVSLAKMANLSQYQLIGRSSSGSGVPQAISTSADVYTMLGSANNAAIRTNIGLDTMATQAAGSVAITGGSITSLSTLHGTAKASTNTTGTLALADADTICFMTGNVTLDGAVFSARQVILLYAGASSRTITQGTSMTLRLGGTATTGDRTMAAYTVAAAVVIDTNTIIITGAGVT
jgi:hypothetical protein